MSWGNLTRPHTLMKSYKQLIAAERRRISFLQGGSMIGDPILGGQPAWAQQIVFVCVCMNLRGSGGGDVNTVFVYTPRMETHPEHPLS